jgi:formylglycine-generating enzyme required for sulfatase activity
VEFVRVPAGLFLMGWEAGHPSERPVHEVWADAFLIAATPATNAEYAR